MQTKNHLKCNQSIEVVCITYQTVVHFKHHKAEQTPANLFGVNDSLLQNHYNYEQRGGSHLRMRQQVEYKNNQKVINQLKLFVSFIKRWCTLNITKLNKSRQLIRSKN